MIVEELDFGSVAVSVATAQLRNCGMRGTRGGGVGLLTRIGPPVPIRPSHHITKSPLHKHDAT